ncbi:hypothetical protein DFJ63DRAFT_312153 [Scheffersomyces coipomensis]|uniref:uncharacterized protein n=1 Tax=Scheffersomyces coipomensis TaxID=1788519 RepID=UPI00315D8992
MLHSPSNLYSDDEYSTDSGLSEDETWMYDPWVDGWTSWKKWKAWKESQSPPPVIINYIYAEPKNNTNATIALEHRLKTFGIIFGSLTGTIILVFIVLLILYLYLFHFSEKERTNNIDLEEQIGSSSTRPQSSRPVPQPSRLSPNYQQQRSPRGPPRAKTNNNRRSY